jgi:4-hydroxy-tetrahydrodipicolinate synthase
MNVMDKIQLYGLGVALVTPFKKDDSVDFDALAKLVDYLLVNGVDYLVVLGTTAETPTLTQEEKTTIVQHVVQQVHGRVLIVVGVGGNCTHNVVSELANNNLQGVDAILSVVPYYSKPTQEGIYQHFKCVAQASPLPVILYNVPGRTGVNMTAETTLRLAHETTNIIAVKEASGNMTQIELIVKNKPAHFEVISGDDSMTLSLMGIGAIGVISVIGNALPYQAGKMVKLMRQGKTNEAQQIHQQLATLFELLFVDGNPAGIKGVLHQLGMVDNVLRLPLVPARAATIRQIYDELTKLKVTGGNLDSV